MRKPALFAVSAILALIAGFSVSAQTISSLRFGVFGGYTASRASGASTELYSFDVARAPLYHAGVTAQVPLFSSFTIQPSIAWQMKGANLSKIVAGVPQYDLKARMGYIETSVGLQYGPDLLLFRPFVLVEPYLGIGVYAKDTAGALETSGVASSAMPRMEWGTGVGLGFEIWHLQMSFKWFWNFGKLYSEKNAQDAAMGVMMKEAFENGGNFRGFSLSLAWFLF